MLRLLLTCLLTLAFVGSLRAQSWQWAQAVPSPSSAITAAAPDAGGGTVVTGWFSDQLTLGAFTLTSAGGLDLFVARLNAAGQWTQAVRAGSTFTEEPYGLALAADGSVTITGSFRSGTVAFGPTTLTNTSSTISSGEYLSDVFVARLSPAGQWTMAAQAAGTYGDYPAAVALAPNGDAVITGEFYGATISFGALVLANDRAPIGNFDFPHEIFVARLNAAGQWTQAVRAGGTGSDRPRALTLDAGGNATIAGYFTSSTCRFGPLPPIVNAGRNEAFVARLSAAGQWTYAAPIGGTNDDYGLTLAGNAAGDVVVGGYYYSGSLTLGSYTLTNTNTGFSNGFLARLSAANVWTQAAAVTGPAGSRRVTGLALDTNDEVVACGFFTGAYATFGTLPNLPGNALNPTLADLFVARLSPAGIWSEVAGANGPGTDLPNAVVLSAAGRPTVVGQFTGASLRFGSTPELPGGTFNTGFVAHWDAVTTAAAGARPARLFTLAPNPARTTATLALPAGLVDRPVLVVDARGRVVGRQVLPAGMASVALDVAGLAPGLYVVRCGAATGRLVVE